MNKKIISIILTCLLTISLVGCDTKDVVKSNSTEGTGTRFVDTGDSYTAGWVYSVYYDSKTNIAYLVADLANASGVSVMYDKYGNPMTLENYNKTK